MGIKQSMKNVAARMGGYAGDVYSNIRPEWGNLRATMMNVASNPENRGYSAEDINNVKNTITKSGELARANTTGSIAGSKTSATENLNKSIAGGGFGNTSMGVRMKAQMDRDYAKQLRESNNAIDLQQMNKLSDVDWNQAQAKREDLWKAYQGWSGALSGEEEAINTAAGIESGQVNPLMGAHNVSGMSSFAQLMGALKGAGGGSSKSASGASSWGFAI